MPYDAKRHRGGVRGVLARNHWEGRYIAGQLDGLRSLSVAPASGARGKVYVHEAGGRVGGFVSVEYREWNRLGQLHGLAVDPDLKRRGIASVLVGRAEGGAEGAISGRELEVLLLAARGLSNEQIASSMHVAQSTVKRHLASVYEKMGVNSRGEAAREALMRDWITIEEIKGPAPGQAGPS